MWWVGTHWRPNEICLFQSALRSCSGYSRMYTHPSCSDAPVWSCSHFPDGKANMLVEQLAKCALPALAFPSVWCKYSSMSQSRRSLSYARVLHSGVLCSTESLSLVYCEETSFGAASWTEIRSRVICFSLSLHRRCTRTNLTSWRCIVKRWEGRTTRRPCHMWTALSSKYRTETCCCHLMLKKNQEHYYV